MDKAKTITSYTDKLLDSLDKNPEHVLSQIRQRMHDKLPRRAEGHVGQKVVDALSGVKVTRSLIDLTFYIQFVFTDPDGNGWTLDREFTYRIDPDTMGNAEAYMWEQAMMLTEDDFAQLAVVLT